MSSPTSKPSMSPWQCLLKCCQGTNARLDRLLNDGYGPAAFDSVESVITFQSNFAPELIVQANPQRRLLVFGIGIGTSFSVTTNPNASPGNHGLFVQIVPIIIDYQTWGSFCTAAWYALEQQGGDGCSVFELSLRSERIGQTGT